MDSEKPFIYVWRLTPGGFKNLFLLTFALLEQSLVRGFNILRLQALERSNVDVGDQGVELVGRIFVFVAQTGQTNAYSEWDVSKNDGKIK